MTNTRISLKNKYPKLFKICSLKYMGVLITLGVLIQILGFLFFSFKSFRFLSGVLFISVIWWLCVFFYKTIFKHTQIWIHAIFIALLVAEVFMRLIGAVTSYTERQSRYYIPIYHHDNSYFTKRDSGNYSFQNCSKGEFDYNICTNSLGYRDKEWYWEEMKNKKRILALGDSFTEGIGVHQDSTWVKELERFISDTSFYFMNAGIGGSDPFYDVYRFENNLIKFKPDIIILTINWTDKANTIVRGGNTRFAKGYAQNGPWWEYIYVMSHTFRVLMNKFYDTETLVSYNRLEECYKVALSQIEKLVNNICENYPNIDFYIVFNPLQFEIENSINPYSKLIKSLESSGKRVIDLYSYYNKPEIKNSIEDYYWPKDNHHNAKGYKLMAKGIYEGLAKYGFFEETLVVDNSLFNENYKYKD